jgi:hypothetical protein
MFDGDVEAGLAYYERSIGRHPESAQPAPSDASAPTAAATR